MATASHLERMLTASQVCEQLGGQMKPHTLRKLARLGKIPGAARVGNKVLFDRRTASWLVVDLSAPPPRYEGLPSKVFGEIAS